MCGHTLTAQWKSAEVARVELSDGLLVSFWNQTHAGPTGTPGNQYSSRLKTTLMQKTTLTALNTHKLRWGGCEAEAGQTDFMSTLSTGHQPQRHIEALRERTGQALAHGQRQPGWG